MDVHREGFALNVDDQSGPCVVVGEGSCLKMSACPLLSTDVPDLLNPSNSLFFAKEFRDF